MARVRAGDCGYGPMAWSVVPRRSARNRGCSKKGIEPDGAAGLGAGERRVEEIDERGGEAKTLFDLAKEIGAERIFSGEVRGDAPLTPPDPLDGGVIGWEAFGRTREGHGIVHGEGAKESTAGDKTFPLGVVLEEVTADGEELILFGHVDAGSDDELGIADMQVVAAAGGFDERAVGPPRALMGFVGLFVGGETRVAVNAEERFGSGTDVVGRVVEHAVVELLDEGEHGKLHGLLVDGAALFEPLAAIIAFEAAEEAKGFRSEADGGSHGDNCKGAGSQGLGAGSLWPVAGC